MADSKVKRENSKSDNIAASSAASATKSFFGGITGTLGVIVGLVIALLLCCGVVIFIVSLSQNSSTNGTATKVGDNSSTTISNSVTNTPVTKAFKVNDKIQVGDYTITVTAYEGQVTADKYSQPQSGNKYIAVEVLYENNTSSKILSYNPNDWSLSDSSGYRYTYSWNTPKEPALHSGEINPGGKSRGWLSFEVPTSSTNYTLQFSAGLFSSENAEIQLY